MRSQLITVLSGALGAAYVAAAQGEATWLWSVTTQNGDAIVAPGETALVTLEVMMESKLYDPDMFAFGAAFFDTLGKQGAAFGQIVDWKILGQLDVIYGDTTTSDGVSLFGTMTGQYPQFPKFSQDNPIAVFEFEWMPLVMGRYVVEYETYSNIPDHEHEINVWIAQEPGDFDDSEFWPVSEAAISFQVVPGPPSLWVLAVAPMTMRRRRR